MRDAEQSHQHSLLTLEILNQFDDFKTSIGSIADLGCGQGHDIQYWANLREITKKGKPGE